MFLRVPEFIDFTPTGMVQELKFEPLTLAIPQRPEVAYNHLEQAELLGFACQFIRFTIIFWGESTSFASFFVDFTAFFSISYFPLGEFIILGENVHDFPWNSSIKSGKSTSKSQQIPQFIHQSSMIFHGSPPDPPDLSTSCGHPRLKEDIWDVLPEIQDVASAKVAVKQALAPLREAGEWCDVGKSSTKTMGKYRYHGILTGWWFGTFFVFPYIGNNHPNWLIFFTGVQTTNQIICIFFMGKYMEVP